MSLKMSKKLAVEIVFKVYNALAQNRDISLIKSEQLLCRLLALIHFSVIYNIYNPPCTNNNQLQSRPVTRVGPLP